MKRELLDNGNIWQKSDGRWIGMVRYKDEFGVAQRKSFSSKNRNKKYGERLWKTDCLILPTSILHQPLGYIQDNAVLGIKNPHNSTFVKS